MEALSEDVQRVARTYSAAADHFLAPALGFWDRWGAATVSRLGLSPGGAVLDLCCGAGASAIPAAHAVGPAGSVLGVDLAESLLALGRARAERERLTNLEFRHCDATQTGLEPGSFDAVACVFGVFFAADMPGFLREMWRLVRPGGKLAVTTWGRGWAEPGTGVFWDCVRELDASLVRAFSPWDEIDTPEALAELFARAGIAPAAIEPAAGEQGLEKPADFWDIVLGSGLRGTVDALAPPERAKLRERTLAAIAARRVESVRLDVLFGSAERAVDADR